MTGKNGPQRQENGPSRPFPVKDVVRGLCMAMRGLETILWPVSLYLYKNSIIDRKWMNVILFTIKIIRFACNSLSVDNKLKDTEI